MDKGTSDHGPHEPVNVDPSGFNPVALLPYGLTTANVFSAMRDFVSFLGFINNELYRREVARLETIMMAANFSSLVGEFIHGTIPKYCPSLVRNQYHNGHPDLIPHASFPHDRVQYGHEGIEVKASRYDSGWQGHNPENVWLMVFVYESNVPRDEGMGVKAKSFRFLRVYAAELGMEDWKYYGRSEQSRRTVNASIIKSGRGKMIANWIYRAPDEPIMPISLPESVEDE